MVFCRLSVICLSAEEAAGAGLLLDTMLRAGMDLVVRNCCYSSHSDASVTLIRVE